MLALEVYSPPSDHFIRSISRNFRKIGKIRVGGCLLALASTSPVRNPGFATVVCFQQLSIQASINILGVFSIFGHLTNTSHNNDWCCLRVTLPQNFGKWQRPTNGTLSFYGCRRNGGDTQTLPYAI